MDNGLVNNILYMLKTARSTKVTISKNGRSWTFPSMESAAKYFSAISSLSRSQISKMIESREQYICGFYITYNE